MKSSITKNFAFLSSVQFFNVILPFVVIPFLTRVIGIEKFGLVNYAQALTTYFVVLADYGFITTATRAISLNRDDQGELSKIFSAVITLKILLTVLGFILFSLLIVSIPSFRSNWILYITSYLLVVGQAIFPLWFFQGIEQMKYISILNVSAKIIFTILIFLFINKPDDYLFVNIFNGLGAILIGVISLLIVKKQFQIKFALPTMAEMKFQLHDGFNIFISNFSINSYINSGVIILGFFAAPIVIGYYSIADKIIFSSRALLVVISQSIFPHVCRLSAQSFLLVKAFLRKILVMLFFLFSVISLVFFFLPDMLLNLIIGYSNPSIVLIMKILSFVPFVIALNIPANQILLCYNFKKGYSALFIAGASISVLLNLCLSFYYGSVGTAISVILTEVFITSALYLLIARKYPDYRIIGA